MGDLSARCRKLRDLLCKFRTVFALQRDSACSRNPEYVLYKSICGVTSLLLSILGALGFATTETTDSTVSFLLSPDEQVVVF